MTVIAGWALIGASASLLVIWLGYPMGIAVYAAAKERLKAGETNGNPVEAPTVSVVLATREDAAVVRQRIQDVMRTNYDTERLEIIVAVDVLGSRCAPADFVGRANVRPVDGDPPGGKASTLNGGVRAARGEVLVFADSFQSFEPEAIPWLVASLQRPHVGAVSGRCEFVKKGKGGLVMERYWAAEQWLRDWEAKVHSCAGVVGPISAMWRSLWQPLPAGLILDDLYYPMRLVLDGHRVSFERRAVAIDSRPRRAEQEYQRKVRTLTGIVQLCRWLPQVLLPWRNPIWLQFVFHKLLRMATPYLMGTVLLSTVYLLLAATYTAVGPVGPAATVALVLTLLSFKRIRVTLSQVWYWLRAVQVAPVIALLNGIRGRWDVWVGYTDKPVSHGAEAP